MPGELEFEVRFRRSAARGRSPAGQGPFRILVLGDLGGRGEGNAGTLSGRRPVAVDGDSFEAVMGRFEPRLRRSDPGFPACEIVLGGLEDLHPDRLLERAPLFATLRELRRRLTAPTTFAAAAAELGSLLQVSAPATQPVASTPREDDAATLERLLGRPAGGAASVSPARPPGVDLSRFFQQVTAPHTVPGPDPHRDVYLRALDEALAEQMRAVLRDPGSRALEGLWRSIHGLVAALELSEDLQVFLLDATRGELAADLQQAGPDLPGSALYRLLGEEGGPGAPGDKPWALFVGNHAFGPEQADLDLLAALGAVASQIGVPFLAGARPELLGCRSLVETPDPRQWPPLEREAELRWQALRRSPAARWMGLVLPRVLLRLPYGRATDPVDEIPFEELGPARPHEAYLWGNPAFVAARLLGEAFRERGWDMEPGDRLEVGGLPAHVVEEGAEKVLVPCAEVCLGERGAQAVLGRGIMPLLSYRDRNAVRLARFQSLADPAAPLAGPWD